MFCLLVQPPLLGPSSHLSPSFHFCVGVLRGARSRFQLFGDTVNTAAVMEGTGVVNKIHVTQATADLLIRDGKQHWVTRRKEPIEAKGKGVIQTYCTLQCVLF